MQDRLGRYLLLQPLAAGGMGEILLAEHTGLSGFAKRVALKRIRPEYARISSYVDLFLNEARLGSFLNHPNIVHIFDVGHERDELWLVMEYVDGVDLKRLTRRSKLAGQPIGGPALAAVMVEVLAALVEAHGGGPHRGEPIIHRDLSPENVLVARSGAVKVLDFGLAKWSPGNHEVPSLEGDVIFGKTRYMPPEQLKGELIDVRSDLFALGVVMYEALFGALPFGSGSAVDVLARIMAGTPPGPTAGSRVPDPAIDYIVLKAIRPSRRERFQTAGDMRAALIGYLQERGAVLPLEPLRRMLQPGGAISAVPASGPAEPAARVANGRGRSATEIDLAVAKRCGKCGGSFAAYFSDGLIFDRCSACQGTWIDAGEAARLLGQTTFRPPVPESTLPSGGRAPLDGVIGSCPSCRVGLRIFAVPGQPAAFEVCPSCHGVWLDEGETVLLHDEDVVTWFKTLLDSLKALR